MHAEVSLNCTTCGTVVQLCVETSIATAPPACVCGSETWQMTWRSLNCTSEFVGLSPRDRGPDAPELIASDFTIEVGCIDPAGIWHAFIPDVPVGGWNPKPAREPTEEEKALHRAIKHHQP